MPSLNIKSEEAHRLATEIAEATGQSITKVVIDALREKRQKTGTVGHDLSRRLLAYGARFRAKAGDLPTSAEAMDDLYDELGLPK